MIATHRVLGKNRETLGFIVSDYFYTEPSVRQGISEIDNLFITATDVIRAKKKLIEIEYSELMQRIYSDELRKAPFTRDIQQELVSWKQRGDETVLQLDGARQVGKTSELKKFAYLNYDRVVYVNLTEDEDAVFKNIMKKHRISPMGLATYCREVGLVKFENSRNTILIIDEIQIDHEVYNMIRSLRGNLSCDIIVTGSYLGSVTDKKYFNPAGTVEYLTMFPLSFSEFCRVYGKKEVLESLDIFGGSPPSEYDDLFELYSVYKQIGGYPAVVKEYFRSQDLKRCMSIIRNLIRTFTDESERYLTDIYSMELFSSAYYDIFRYICNRSNLDTGNRTVIELTDMILKSTNTFYSRKNVLEVILWLKKAGVVGFCDYYNNGDVNDKERDRRVYFLDCGIANCLSQSTNVDSSTVAGILTEIFTFSELTRLCAAQEKIVREEKPCFSKLNMYELDFMMVGTDGVRYGIEVKTSKHSGTSVAISLQEYLRLGKINVAVIANAGKGGQTTKNKITIPIYTVGVAFPYKQKV